MPNTTDLLSERQHWLRELSCADSSELRDLAEALIARLAPQPLELRRPEVGLTLVTARVGGTGDPFGLGEMTVTRSVVQVGDEVGVGYTKGRDAAHATRVAILDALLQGSQAGELRTAVLEPLAEIRQARAAKRNAETEATRVQFLTMVRGN